MNEYGNECAGGWVAMNEWVCFGVGGECASGWIHEWDVTDGEMIMSAEGPF